MSERKWQEFVDWAEIASKGIDLSEHEHDYKRQWATVAATARQQWLTGDLQWPTTIVSGLQANNLLHWMTVAKVKKAADERTEQLSEALAILWSAEALSLDLLAAFEEPLRKAVDKVSPGNVTAIGALMLMARDAENWPPYRATPVTEWSALVGLDKPGKAPAERYGRLIELCDGLLARKVGRLPVTTRLEAQGLGWAVTKWDVGDLPLNEDQRTQLRAWRHDEPERQAYHRGVGPAPEMEQAAWRLLEAGLTGQPSALMPSRPNAWTIEAGTDLRERIQNDPGPELEGFTEKLKRQLQGAPDATKLLAAELVYLQCVGPDNLTAKTKIERVQAVLKTVNSDEQIPADIRDGLEAEGAFNGGMGFNAQIAQHIDWLCRFVSQWSALEPVDRRTALRDPIAFARISAGVSEGRKVGVEYSLNYLAWPGHLSPIISADHRVKIRDAFAAEIDGDLGNESIDITRGLMELRRLHEAELGRYPSWYRSPYREMWDENFRPNPVKPEPTIGVPLLPTVSEQLAAALHMPVPELQEMLDVLQVRQQIVFYGPPGTGKTFVARELARHIAGHDSAGQVRLVQFHPSYSYEDFFEGFRPTVTDTGQSAFALTNGPLRELAAEAARPENHAAPFVLIIDEMNRANLAKVFGELYFLLEYRNESVRLQYSSSDSFRLPSNLFIIGTMNTADRSIAMVDAAIRRRFAFMEMHPTDEPVRGVLDRFLGEGHDDRRALLLAELNSAIGTEDRDLQIGPSYLMRSQAETEAGLAQIWRFDILPLLEEHYYGRMQRAEIHNRFGLPAMRARVAAKVAAEAELES